MNKCFRLDIKDLFYCGDFDVLWGEVIAICCTFYVVNNQIFSFIFTLFNGLNGSRCFVRSFVYFILSSLF